MAMQRWKIERELKRVVLKSRNGFDLVTGPGIQRYRDRKNLEVVTTGHLELRKDLIVFLLFPKNGVPESIFEQLTFLWNQGVSPLVVSNGSLNQGVRERLLRYVHLLIERPNFGYDFGGYRAGILEILHRGYDCSNIFVMNDSLWFPLSQSCQLIENARKHPADLFGIYYNERPKQSHRSHLQSYFYRFSSDVCASPEFRNFWRNLTAYNNKDLTVRRNEMRLTHWFKSKGFSIGCQFDHEDLKKSLATLSVSERYSLAQYHIMIGDKFSNHIAVRCASNAYHSDEIYYSDIETGVLGRYFLICHPEVLVDRMKCPILKKDMKKPYQLQRALFLESSASQGLSETLVSEMKLATEFSDSQMPAMVPRKQK